MLSRQVVEFAVNDCTEAVTLFVHVIVPMDAIGSLNVTVHALVPEYEYLSEIAVVTDILVHCGGMIPDIAAWGYTVHDATTVKFEVLAQFTPVTVSVHTVAVVTAGGVKVVNERNPLPFTEYVPRLPPVPPLNE